MNTQTTYEIKESNWPERTFLIKKGIITFDKLPDFFSNTYGALYAFIQKASLSTSEPPCAIYYTINEAKQETELAAAAPVHGPVPENTEFETFILPQSKVITTTHMGPYDSMVPAYQAIQEYIDKHGLKKTLIIEEYFSDPQKEKDPARIRTDIHFIV